MQESLILVDQTGRRTGVAERGVCHQGKGIRHRAFVTFLFTSDGRFLVQKRAACKLGYDSPVQGNTDEMDEIRWLTFADLSVWFEQDEKQFTQWFAEAFRRMSRQKAGLD